MQPICILEAVTEIGGFHAFNGWLESFKMSYGIRETTNTIAGKACDIPITTVKTWMENLPGYSKICMNLGYVSRYCHKKVMLERERKVEVENKVKNDAASPCLWLLMALRFGMEMRKASLL